MCVLLLSTVPGLVRAGVADVMLVLGDSLSAGYGIRMEESWPALLATKLESQGYPYQVVNASISGETTAGGAQRLPALLDTHHPRVVVIALGANDGLRGIAPDEVATNLTAMLARVRAAGGVAVLLRVRIPPNYGPQYVSRFESVYAAAAEETAGVVLAPFMLERFATDSAAFQSDGLHPVAAVQGDILDTLWPTLASAIELADRQEAAP